MNGKDVVEALRLGADGVQMGTRFALSEESSAADSWKEHVLKAKESDMVLIQSPVGLPGRAIRNSFTTAMDEGSDVRRKGCDQCLKQCERNFCIMERLVKAQQGDLTEGLVFSGSEFSRIKKVQSVREIFEDIKKEILQAE